MKRILFVILLLFGLIGLAWAADDEEPAYDSNGDVIKTQPTAAPAAATAFKGFLVYEDKSTTSNHYAPSGWMGDYNDLNLDYGYNKEPHGGKTCIKISYSARGSQNQGWAGMFWQNPPGNWGEKKGGYNLTGATKLTFWARGEKGNEKIKAFKIGGISGAYSDTDVASMGPVILHKDWRQYSINLKGKDLTYISGGFCWVATAADNPTGITFYLDDIKYE